jgi:hypothetical protein
VPGWGRAGYAPLREDAAVLKAEAEYLAAALEETRSRLAALESDNDE